MKTSILLLSLMVVAILINSCSYDEDELTASGITEGYKIPQGNHDFDTGIETFYKKYESALLYEFTDKDTYWTPSGWKNGKEGALSGDGAGSTGYLVVKANTDYISRQLELLNKTWFRFYSDSFLKEFLPMKIMLCASVQDVKMDFSSWPFTYAGQEVPSYYNYDNICVSYGSSLIDNLSNADTMNIVTSINRTFIESMLGRSKVEPTSQFTKAVSYENINSIYVNNKVWALGIFPPAYSATATTDWMKFLYMMVTYPESYLTKEPTAYYGEYDNTEAAWEGILNRVKDVNGLLKKRYDMVRNYYIDNYKTDLQQIGNTNTNYQ